MIFRITGFELHEFNCTSKQESISGLTGIPIANDINDTSAFKSIELVVESIMNNKKNSGDTHNIDVFKDSLNGT